MYCIIKYSYFLEQFAAKTEVCISYLGYAPCKSKGMYFFRFCCVILNEFTKEVKLSACITHTHKYKWDMHVTHGACTAPPVHI